jgi:hypothetical protein
MSQRGGTKVKKMLISAGVGAVALVAAAAVLRRFDRRWASGP